MSKLCILAVVMGFLVIFTAARIEYYNCISGGRLPRTTEGKWRVTSVYAAELNVDRLYRNEKGIPDHQKLTVAQEEELAQRIAEEVSEKDIRRDQNFRGFVSTLGLLQYLIVPGLLLMSVLLGCRKKTSERAIGLIGIAASLMGGFLMIFRDYYGSLGW